MPLTGRQGLFRVRIGSHRRGLACRYVFACVWVFLLCAFAFGEYMSRPYPLKESYHRAASYAEQDSRQECVVADFLLAGEIRDYQTRTKTRRPAPSVILCGALPWAALAGRNLRSRKNRLDLITGQINVDEGLFGLHR